MVYRFGVPIAVIGWYKTEIDEIGDFREFSCLGVGFFRFLEFWCFDFCLLGPWIADFVLSLDLVF